jgi:hypothetical protein
VVVHSGKLENINLAQGVARILKGGGVVLSKMPDFNGQFQRFFSV